MVRDIVRDPLFLSQKSGEAAPADIAVGEDLRDTLDAHRDRCVGMAANMIGVKKRIVIVNAGLFDLVLYNPAVTKKSGPFEAEEGCLSLDGTRKTVRYRTIEVVWRDENWKSQKQTFTGRTAQIIQHELDHLDGILI